MCLYLDRYRNSTTFEEDKVVYKVFMYENKKDKVILLSPYRFYEYDSKENYEPNFDAENENKLNFVENGIYSFEDFEAAKTLKYFLEAQSLRFDSKWNRSKYIVLKCRIPKGTPTYIGGFSHIAYMAKPKCYCSERLIIDDESFTVEGVEYKLNLK